jgi:hypothetical protein
VNFTGSPETLHGSPIATKGAVKLTGEGGLLDQRRGKQNAGQPSLPIVSTRSRCVS